MAAESNCTNEACMTILESSYADHLNQLILNFLRMRPCYRRKCRTACLACSRSCFKVLIIPRLVFYLGSSNYHSIVIKYVASAAVTIGTRAPCGEGFVSTNAIVRGHIPWYLYNTLFFHITADENIRRSQPCFADMAVLAKEHTDTNITIDHEERTECPRPKGPGWGDVLRHPKILLGVSTHFHRNRMQDIFTVP
jgi:hypothetical protein